MGVSDREWAKTFEDESWKDAYECEDYECEDDEYKDYEWDVDVDVVVSECNDYMHRLRVRVKLGPPSNAFDPLGCLFPLIFAVITISMFCNYLRG